MLLAGDWNTKVQNDTDEKIVGLHGLGNKDEGGEYLLSSCLTNYFFIADTVVKQRKQNACVHERHQMEYTEITLIIIGTRKWKTSKIYRSDHEIICVQVSNRAKAADKRYSVSMFS